SSEIVARFRYRVDERPEIRLQGELVEATERRQSAIHRRPRVGRLQVGLARPLVHRTWGRPMSIRTRSAASLRVRATPVPPHPVPDFAPRCLSPRNLQCAEETTP